MSGAEALDGPGGEERRATFAVSFQTAVSIGTFFIAKEAMRSLPPGPMLLLRSLGAVVPLWLLVRWRGGSVPAAPRPGDGRRLFALGVLGVPLNQGCFLLGLAHTSAAHAALLYALTPALVLLIGAVRGTERLSPARVGGVVAAFAGVALVLAGAGAGPVDDPAHRATLAGDLIVLAAVAAWAGYTALSKPIVERLGSARATFATLSLGALAYLPVGLWSARAFDPAAVQPIGWIGVGWLVLFSSTLSYVAWYYAIRRLDPSRVAIFVNLQPIGTALISWAVLGAPLPGSFLLGGALVLSGVLLVQRG